MCCTPCGNGVSRQVSPPSCVPNTSPIARGDVDLLGVAVMQADRHHRAVRLHLVEALPGLADVLAAVERAVLRRGGDAQAGVERVRLLRRNLDVAAVGDRREAVHLHVLPGLALVAAAEQAHAHRDDDAVRIGRADADRVAVEHAFGFGVADDLALSCGSCSARRSRSALQSLQVSPPSVDAHHAADLQRREDLVRA